MHGSSGARCAGSRSCSMSSQVNTASCAAIASSSPTAPVSRRTWLHRGGAVPPNRSRAPAGGGDRRRCSRRRRARRSWCTSLPPRRLAPTSSASALAHEHMAAVGPDVSSWPAHRSWPRARRPRDYRGLLRAELRSGGSRRDYAPAGAKAGASSTVGARPLS
jgi:hypothetical protein